MKRINASGGPPQVICAASVGRGGTWYRDGTIVFAPGIADALLRASADGGAVQPASKLDTDQGEHSHAGHVFFPTAGISCFGRKNPWSDRRSLCTWGGTLKAKLVISGGPPPFYVPGYLLFVRGQVLMTQPFDVSKISASGEPVPSRRTGGGQRNF